MTFQKGHPDFVRNHRGGLKFNKLYCKNGHYKTSQIISFRIRQGNLTAHDCKVCRSKRVKLFRHAENLRQKGLTVEIYNKMFSDQNGCCKICGTHQSKLRAKLAVDHCHSSGKVRALLCHACNLILGNAKDDASILQRSIVYLKSFGGDAN